MKDEDKQIAESDLPEEQPINKSLTADYTLERAELESAVEIDNKKKGLYRRQKIMLVIIFVLFAYFGVFQWIVNPDNWFFALIIIGMTVACSVILVWFPKKTDQKYVDKVMESWPRYLVSIQEDGVHISDSGHPENTKRRLHFAYDGQLVAYETTRLFLFLFNQKRLFCVPKRHFTMDEIVEIHDLLYTKCKDNFMVLDEKTGKAVGRR